MEVWDVVERFAGISRRVLVEMRREREAEVAEWWLATDSACFERPEPFYGERSSRGWGGRLTELLAGPPESLPLNASVYGRRADGSAAIVRGWGVGERLLWTEAGESEDTTWWWTAERFHRADLGALAAVEVRGGRATRAFQVDELRATEERYGSSELGVNEILTVHWERDRRELSALEAWKASRHPDGRLGHLDYARSYEFSKTSLASAEATDPSVWIGVRAWADAPETEWSRRWDWRTDQRESNPRPPAEILAPLVTGLTVAFREMMDEAVRDGSLSEPFVAMQRPGPSFVNWIVGEEALRRGARERALPGRSAIEAVRLKGVRLSLLEHATDETLQLKREWREHWDHNIQAVVERELAKTLNSVTLTGATDDFMVVTSGWNVLAEVLGDTRVSRFRAACEAPDQTPIRLPRITSREAIGSAANALRLAAHADRITASVRTAHELIPATGDTQIVGRIGGLPPLTSQQEWPLNQGRPLSFLGVIDLDAMLALTEEPVGLGGGLLLFFADAVSWTGEPEDVAVGAGAQVFVADVGAAIVSGPPTSRVWDAVNEQEVDFPVLAPVPVTVRSRLMLPPTADVEADYWDSVAYDRLLEHVNRDKKPRPVAQWLGHPESREAGDLLEPGDRPLFQVFDDRRTRFSFLDAGTITFAVTVGGAIRAFGTSC